MLDVLITGVGGQGSVLAARVLAEAAKAKGWQVRTAETKGMAQRGGFVTSHVRMGNLGEQVYAPLLASGTADLVIALEPAEGARVLSYLAQDGLMVVARSAVQPVSAQLSEHPYVPGDIIAALEGAVPNLIVVDDVALCHKIGSRKVLNLALLTTAVQASIDAASEGRTVGIGDAVSILDLRSAVVDCVKDSFIEINLKAVRAAVQALADPTFLERPKANGNGHAVHSAKGMEPLSQDEAAGPALASVEDAEPPAEGGRTEG